MKQRHLAKVFGSALGLCGALVVAFVKGPAVYSGRDNQVSGHSREDYSTADWIKGSVIMITANITWSLWLIMQVHFPFP